MSTVHRPRLVTPEIESAPAPATPAPSQENRDTGRRDALGRRIVRRQVTHCASCGRPTRAPHWHYCSRCADRLGVDVFDTPAPAPETPETPAPESPAATPTQSAPDEWIDFAPPEVARRAASIARREARRQRRASRPAPQSPAPETPARPSISDSESEIQSLIGSIPDLETAPEVFCKLLSKAWQVFNARGHDRFLIAWNWGRVFAEARSKCVHGNSKAVKKGSMTLSKWRETYTPFTCDETVNRWADLWEYIQPENPHFRDRFKTLDYETARALVRDLKSAPPSDAGDDAAPTKSRKSSKGRKGHTGRKGRIVPPLGNAVSAMFRAAESLYQSAKQYTPEQTTDSNVRESDALRAFYEKVHESCRLILDAAAHLASLSETILKTESAEVRGNFEKLRDLHLLFAAKGGE